MKKKKAKSFSEDTNMLPEFYDNVEELTSAQVNINDTLVHTN